MDNIKYLMENADASIRYRVARELMKDEKAAKQIESELLNHPMVVKWLDNLNSKTPIVMDSADNHFNNAMLKCIQLGLHGGLQPMKDSVQTYVNELCQYNHKPFRNKHTGFCNIIYANFLCLAEIKNETVYRCLLNSLDELYEFVIKGSYDIYVNEDERNKLTGIPELWKNRKFIKYELVDEYGFCFPLSYDIPGLHMLYGLYGKETDEKINAVIEYISNDTFHDTIADGYGILIEKGGKSKYHAMGYAPKYPGWHDLAGFMKDGFVSSLLFFTQYIAKYPVARQTKWFSELLAYLNNFKTDEGHYRFPSKWLHETKGYSIFGMHMSFGENRRKRNWIEIESTFFMELLRNADV